MADNGASGYFRVDWFTPDGLPAWGDGRICVNETAMTQAHAFKAAEHCVRAQILADSGRQAGNACQAIRAGCHFVVYAK